MSLTVEGELKRMMDSVFGQQRKPDLRQPVVLKQTPVPHLPMQEKGRVLENIKRD